MMHYIQYGAVLKGLHFHVEACLPGSKDVKLLIYIIPAAKDVYFFLFLLEYECGNTVVQEESRLLVQGLKDC